MISDRHSWQLEDLGELKIAGFAAPARHVSVLKAKQAYSVQHRVSEDSQHKKSLKFEIGGALMESSAWRTLHVSWKSAQ